MSYSQIIFSPTGGTKKCAEILTGALSEDFNTIDLSDANADFSTVTLGADDVAVIAAPVYGGRIPATAAQRLAQIQGNQAKAVLMAVYGNREFEDALVELEDVAKSAGFRIYGAVSAIAEHSIARQFAAGRPDEADAESIRKFATQLKPVLALDTAPETSIPGNRPYKEAGKGMAPATSDACIKCGACVKKCPVKAINAENPAETDAEKCIGCMRCISVCPKKAKGLPEAALAAISTRLEPVCSERKIAKVFV